MMTISQATELICLFAGIAAFAKIVALLHTQTVDTTRADLFELRDEMFLYATDNGLLETEAYRHLRDLMNSFIRYAHRLTATRMLLINIAVLVVPLPQSLSFRTMWTPCLDMLDEDRRKTMILFHNRLKTILARHIVHRSLVLKVTFPIYVIYRNRMVKDDAMREVVDRVPWATMEKEAAAT
jgi:hypothetical protein